MNYKMSKQERAARNSARQEILDAVNEFISRPTCFLMRNIQSAVCIARYNKLVDATTLTKAGFNS